MTSVCAGLTFEQLAGPSGEAARRRLASDGSCAALQFREFLRLRGVRCAAGTAQQLREFGRQRLRRSERAGQRGKPQPPDRPSARRNSAPA